MYRLGADKDECWEDTPLDGVSVLFSEMRFVSIRGGCGDRAGRDVRDICDGDREGGKDDRDVLRTMPLLLPFEPVVPFVGGLYIEPFSTGRAAFISRDGVQASRKSRSSQPSVVRIDLRGPLEIDRNCARAYSTADRELRNTSGMLSSAGVVAPIVQYGVVRAHCSSCSSTMRP